jgi:hypothetical protein
MDWLVVWLVDQSVRVVHLSTLVHAAGKCVKVPAEFPPC